MVTPTLDVLQTSRPFARTDSAREHTAVWELNCDQPERGLANPNSCVAKKRHPPNSGSRTVCVVDDDVVILMSMKRLLEGDGFEVRAFTSGDELLHYLEHNPVPVAILDIWMAGMTGMELMAHLCARSPQTHFIFVTGHEDDAAAATVKPAGPFGFFIKPFDDSEFLTAVHRAADDPLTVEVTEQRHTQTLALLV